MFGVHPIYAQETIPNAENNTLPTVEVRDTSTEQLPTETNDSYRIKKSRSATKLKLTPKETPQTLSVISRTQLNDFRLTNVNSALGSTSGVTVEKVESDRTYYTARGFDITNFQTDGVGVPFIYGNVNGDLDTAIYDRIEIVYGANGLMSTSGFPSATINFVRKRPAADFAASVGINAGSWNQRRVDADVSSPLNQASTVRGRVVAAKEDANSYLDRYARDKTIFYGVVEMDLSSSTQLALGYTQQNNETKSPLWGAIPLVFSDGTPTSYPTSTSTSADWAFWNSRAQSSFAELTNDFANGWSAKAAFTHNVFSNNGALFYVYGMPDSSTGLGLFSYPSRYEMNNRQNIADVSATGQFTLGSRRHDLSFGVNWSESKLTDRSDYGQGIGTALPPLENWDGSYPMPTFDASVDGSNFKDKRHGGYAVVRWNLHDALKLITGLRQIHANNTGVSYGVSRNVSASQATPYAGLIYNFHPMFALYGSYTRIFNPQHEQDIGGDPLSPIQGTSRELGIKGEFFNKALNASLAYFQTDQRNLAELAGNIGPLPYYQGIDAQSKGVQVDLSGEVGAYGHINLGYTQLSIRDQAGIDVRTYVPRRLLRLTTTWRIPQMPKLKVGGNLSWQDDVYAQTSDFKIFQRAYSLLNLMASYDLNKQFNISANINNVFDKKYIASLYWGSFGQGFYGEPRNVNVALNWKF